MKTKMTKSDRVWLNNNKESSKTMPNTKKTCACKKNKKLEEQLAKLECVVENVNMTFKLIETHEQSQRILTETLQEAQLSKEGMGILVQQNDKLGTELTEARNKIKDVETKNAQTLRELNEALLKIESMEAVINIKMCEIDWLNRSEDKWQHRAKMLEEELERHRKSRTYRFVSFFDRLFSRFSS